MLRARSRHSQSASTKMFMPKKNRLAIYSFLFKGARPPRDALPPHARPDSAVYSHAFAAEGVLTCQKDVRLPRHHILDVPNLHVLDALKSLKSRKFVREIFSWQWHYFFLTDEGIEYLRQYLHLEPNVVPATLKKPVGKESGVRPGSERRGGFGRGGFRDRDGEKGAPSGEFRPRFSGEGGYRREGGFGRGRSAGGAPPAGAAPAGTA